MSFKRISRVINVKHDRLLTDTFDCDPFSITYTQAFQCHTASEKKNLCLVLSEITHCEFQFMVCIK